MKHFVIEMLYTIISFIVCKKSAPTYVYSLVLELSKRHNVTELEQ